jgi:hypothetical protein
MTGDEEARKGGRAERERGGGLVKVKQRRRSVGSVGRRVGRGGGGEENRRGEQVEEEEVESTTPTFAALCLSGRRLR